MIGPYDLNRFKVAFLLAKKQGDYSMFERFLEDEERLTKTEFVCEITWSTDDIREIRNDWDDEKLQAAARYCAKGLQDRSTEEGWQILDDLLDMFEREQSKAA